MKLHPSFATIVAAVSLTACGPRQKPVNVIERTDAEQLATAGAHEVRDVGFGGKFVLMGAVTRTTGDGLLLELAWKANGKQKLEYLVPVHVLDADARIVGQADYKQDEKRREVADGTNWRDEVAIPRETLQGATSIGIGLMGDGQKWLPPDRGPRDRDLLRLLLPVPEGLPALREQSPFDGFLEAVNNSEIVGWVWEKGAPGKTLEVEIYDGENLLGKVGADVAREDLEKAGIGDGRHGFRLEMPAQIRDGQMHRIVVRVASSDFELHKSPRTYQWKK